MRRNETVSATPSSSSLSLSSSQQDGDNYEKQQKIEAARKHRERSIASYAFLWGLWLVALFVARHYFALSSSSSTEDKASARLRADAAPLRSGEDVRYSDILSGKFHLIDVLIPPSSVGRGSDAPYALNVKGIFCQLNWAAHKADPSKVPMFKDLLKASKGCKANTITVNLSLIAKAAREIDRRAATAGKDLPRNIPPNGFVFHESRVGSTLVANSLAALDPDKNRVYSESSPLIAAMKACGYADDKSCDVAKSNALLRDVVYLMGRTDDPRESRLFFKIQSVGSTYIHNLRAAFPDTPWIFVYREPVQVMMSHLSKNMKNPSRANCLRTKKNPPRILKKLVKTLSGGTRTYGDINDFEGCAAHLAYLCESAITEHDRSNTGRMVNYATLPNILLDSIIPNYFGLPVGEGQRARVLDVAKTYSKGRSDSKTWVSDTEKKEEAASPIVRAAAISFLDESYTRLQELADQSHLEILR